MAIQGIQGDPEFMMFSASRIYDVSGLPEDTYMTIYSTAQSYKQALADLVATRFIISKPLSVVEPCKAWVWSVAEPETGCRTQTHKNYIEMNTKRLSWKMRFVLCCATVVVLKPTPKAAQEQPKSRQDLPRAAQEPKRCTQSPLYIDNKRKRHANLWRLFNTSDSFRYEEHRLGNHTQLQPSGRTPEHMEVHPSNISATNASEKRGSSLFVSLSCAMPNFAGDAFFLLSRAGVYMRPER